MPSHTIAKISVQAEDFDLAVEVARLTGGRKDIGAVVTFTGLCRDEDGRLEALELEHYPAMASSALESLASKALERWSLTGLTIIHRYGKIKSGENIVLVIAASAHRRVAFEAADFLMDYLKSNAPFWKKEHLVSGEKGAWIEAKSQDEEDLARWNKAP